MIKYLVRIYWLNHPVEHVYVEAVNDVQAKMKAVEQSELKVLYNHVRTTAVKLSDMPKRRS